MVEEQSIKAAEKVDGGQGMEEKEAVAVVHSKSSVKQRLSMSSGSRSSTTGAGDI